LAELITKLLDFEQNGCWYIGLRFMCHTGRYGPEGCRMWGVGIIVTFMALFVVWRNLATLAEG
jgi:hypothetical protein